MGIKEIIKQLANTGLETYCKVCTVDSIDELARTIDCTPIDESAPLIGVNLQANQNSEVGDVSFPVIGSFVVVAFLSSAVAVVVLCDEIEKRLLTIGETKIVISADGIVINGGGLGGLVKAEDVTKKINAIEERCNTLLSTLQGITITLAPSGAIPFAPMFAMESLTTTTAKDIENEKIKHG